jgi:cytidylate kinase
MRKEYDFSKAVKAKFFRKGAELRLPIYLDAKLQGKLEDIARRKGKDISELVNQVLRREVELLEELS